MNNNKQSSIELFAIALYEKGFLKGNGDAINDLLEEHKAMHKEEIMDAIIESEKEDYSNAEVYPPEFVLRKAEKYYNETFGGTTGVIVFDNIHLTNTSGTNHLSHINPLTDKLTNMEVTMSEQNSVVTLIQENESVIKVNKECERGCGNRVTKYDKFTEEEYCENCGWS